MRSDYWLAELAREPALTAGELKGLRKLVRDFLGPVQAPKSDALAYAGISTRRPACLHDPDQPPELVIDSRRVSSIDPEALHIRQIEH